MWELGFFYGSHKEFSWGFKKPNIIPASSTKLTFVRFWIQFVCGLLYSSGCRECGFRSQSRKNFNISNDILKFFILQRYNLNVRILIWPALFFCFLLGCHLANLSTLCILYFPFYIFCAVPQPYAQSKSQIFPHFSSLLRFSRGSSKAARSWIYHHWPEPSHHSGLYQSAPVSFSRFPKCRCNSSSASIWVYISTICF